MKKSSKSVWSRFVMTFAAAFLLMLVTTVPVKADSSVPLVADMKQTDASTTSAGISWSCPGSEVRFKVEMSEQMSSGYWTYKESQSSASITLTKLGAGKVYYVRITPFKYNIEGLNKYTKVKGTTSQPFRVVTAPDSAPASLTLKNLKKGEGYSTRVEPMRQSESGFHVESNNAGEGKIYIE